MSVAITTLAVALAGAATTAIVYAVRYARADASRRMEAAQAQQEARARAAYETTMRQQLEAQRETIEEMDVLLGEAMAAGGNAVAVYHALSRLRGQATDRDARARAASVLAAAPTAGAAGPAAVPGWGSRVLDATARLLPRRLRGGGESVDSAGGAELPGDHD